MDICVDNLLYINNHVFNLWILFFHFNGMLYTTKARLDFMWVFD